MAVVNTNISASIAQAALIRNDRDLASAMEKLSTGRKINSAADNASKAGVTTYEDETSDRRMLALSEREPKRDRKRCIAFRTRKGTARGC